MSQKDLQFIERALAHPWMFWAYFWKWPRLVRQACAEYDLLAKERDAAKAAHERSERANKIVRDWIHVTHRLSTTPEAIRAIFAAGKRLSILLVFFVVTNTYGQAPPYLRNQWTTNANPLALKVISTNGIRVATNIWEVDFTNTATVTVGAVSNAGKVMLSFTSSASGGSDSLWTNVPSGNASLGDILTPVEQYGMFQLATNSLSFFGDQSSLLAFGYPAVDLAQIGTNAAAVILLGDLAGGSAVISNGSFFVVGIGAGALRSSVIDGSTSIYAIGDDALRGARIQNNTSKILAFGNDAFLSSRLMDNTSRFAGFGSGVFDGGIATNSTLVLFAGASAGVSALLVDVSYVLAVGPSAFGSLKASNSVYLTAIGHLAGSSSRITNAYDINLVGAYTGFGAILSRVTNAFAVGYETLMNANLRRVTGVFAADYGAMKGAVLTNCDYVLAVGYDAFENAILTNCNQIHAFGSYAGTNLVLTGKTNVFIFGNVGAIVPTNEEFWFGNTNNVYRMPGNIGTIRGVSGYSWPTAHAAGVWTNDGAGITGWKPLSDFVSGGNGIASVYTNNVLAGGPGLTELGFTNSATVTWTATTNAGRVTMSATSAGGGSQTPWLSDIDAAKFSLTNLNKVVFTNGTTLTEDAANTIAQRNGTSAQLYNIYETFTDSANYSRLQFGYVSANSAFEFASQRAGTGIARSLIFRSVDQAIFAPTGNSIFYSTILAGIDNTYDIGASGATRPRNTYVANVNTSASAATAATNRVAITATGYTNTLTVGSVAVNVDVYFDAATAALQDSAGNALHTFQAGTNITAHLKPNWRLVGTTMTGTVIAH